MGLIGWSTVADFYAVRSLVMAQVIYQELNDKKRAAVRGSENENTVVQS